MEKVTLEFPQLILIGNGSNKYKYLGRLNTETNEPKVNLTFQEDSKQDPRIIAIKYQVLGKENSIFYYSETFDKYALITANLGYGYIGKVLVRDKNDNHMGFNLEHLAREGLRLKHINKINERDDIEENLTPEYVAERYKDLFYNIPRYP
jgi:hypothetical protein